ncbi:S-layer family protein [Paenibacillus taihuensis]|uniref:S-layer family protein n=2 Tax=Paenibacillus taihuensis TaxID=1156355 RepID=A0A3D9SGT4_9BACL|nr:S-layer family protein [Paenibacillus taihuensis]
MKKSLSLIVAAAMTLTSASAVFADNAPALDTQGKFDALKAAGIFNGFPDGSAGLEKEMTRAEFAKVLTLVAGLTPDATAAKYSDVAANHWAAGYIGAASKAGLLNGLGDGKFGPSGKVTIEQIAKVADLFAKAPIDENATVAGAVSAWAKAYVAAAIKAGFIAESSNYKANAVRGQLVEVAYQLANPAPATLEATAKVAGAKKIEVKLNQKVDTSKVTFEVKNAAGTVVNIAKTTFADDKATATLEFAANLLAGDYTVAVKGGSNAASAKVTAEAEKISKIEFLSSTAAPARTGAATDNQIITSSVKISNQYGEDVTATKAGSLTLTSSKGAASLATTGVLTIDNTTAAVNFAKDEKVAVSAIDTASNTFASAVLTVGDKAQVSDISIDKLVNTADSTKVLDAASTPGQFVLELTAKDQYGNTITGAANAANVTSDVIVTVSRTDVANVGAITWNPTLDGGKYTIALAGPLTAGTSKVTVISKTTGKLASFDVVVKETGKVDALTVSAPAVAVAGEAFDIPFTAVDQFGNAITSASTLNNSVYSVSLGSLSLDKTSPATIAASGIKFVQDYVKNTATLHVNALAKGTYVFTAVTGTNKVVQQTITVTDAKTPVVISATKDFTSTLAKTAGTTFTNANVVVNDQYGREITDLAWAGAVPAVGEYKIDVAVSGTATTYNAATGAISAAAKGSDAYTVTLQQYKTVSGVNKWVNVDGTSLAFTVSVVEKADIASYELADIATLKNNGTGSYLQDVTVNGVLASGTKVVLPTTGYYEVTASDTTKLDLATAGKVGATFAAGDFTDHAASANVIVTVDGANGPVVLTKVVKASDLPSVATTFSVINVDATMTLESANVISATAVKASNLATLSTAVIKAVDQYGVEITADTYTTFRTNFADNDSSTTVTAGDTFNVTAVSGANTITFKVIVK